MLATITRGDSMQAHYLAESAANHAMWQLLNDSNFPAAEDSYYMHTLGDGRYGYKVRRHTNTTFATVATVGAVEKNVVQQSYVLYVFRHNKVTYLADTDNHRIRKVDTEGIITTIAGTGKDDYSGDGGPAADAELKKPRGLYVDTSGNIYIADTDNHCIRKIDVGTEIITTIAGTGGAGGYSGDDGPATDAKLNKPHSVYMDASGNIYITDTDNHRIRKVDSEGIITTIAGTGNDDYSGDNGPATNAELRKPRGLHIDTSGNIYVADTDNHCVRKIDVGTGIITSIAGMGESGGYSGDGDLAINAKLNKPHAVYMDTSENIYIADTDNHRIRKVDVETGIITTIAGTGKDDYSGDGGPATDAELKKPRGLYVDTSGNIYIADTDNQRIRKIDVGTGIIITIAGMGVRGFSGDGLPATDAKLNKPHAVYMDTSGNIYIADTDNHRVRKIDVDTEIITTIAGTGTGGYSEDEDGGPATDAKLKNPRGLYVDTSGNIYIADTENKCVRKIDVGTGIITTIAGIGGSGGYSGDDGPATDAKLNKPHAVYMDTSGNIYIADTDNHRIRKVDAGTGIITTIAGTGKDDYSGDDGPATDAELRKPRGLYIDTSGNIYIADTDNHCVRKIDAETGIITTVAGTGGAGGYSGDGDLAVNAKLNKPHAVYMDASENIYIADTDNHRIRKVDAGTGIITTIAGTGDDSYSGDDGPATDAELRKPRGLYVDTSGNIYIYIADTDNHCVRKIDVGTGIITTRAGTGVGGFSEDGGPATDAALNNPHAVFQG